jgi:hypothetical protein
MPVRLTERLSAARRRQFVGRANELAIFQTALTAAEPSFYVLHIFGPGGVGKTTLLHEFVSLCTETQAQAVYLDVREIEPSPDSFHYALQSALGLTPAEPVVDFLAEQSGRYALLLDTYETFAPLDNWLRRAFLPQLPDNVLTVLAGRQPPAPEWRIDPGWQSLIQIVPLRNLSSEESRTYLTKCHIPAQQHPMILNFTHGHPLALSLVTDTFAQRRDAPKELQPEVTSDIINILLKQLVQKVPSPAHRAALEACAIVRLTTEALLADMLALPASPTALTEDSLHELFEWLRSLSFIEVTQGGLFPHDLVREALVADVRWRNPDWYTELHRRARAYYMTHMERSSSQAQQNLLLDMVFLHRDNQVVRQFFEWQSSGSTFMEPMRQADTTALIDMVAQHEGQESARLAGYWFQRQPEGVLVFRDVEDNLGGFMALIRVERATLEDINTDPATQAVWNYLQQHAPLRPGERATLFRFWLARETYQNVSPLQSLIFINAVQHYLTTPGLAFTFFPCAQPDFWANVFAYADLMRLPTADFEVGGRRYGMYGHDWRITSPAAWLELLAKREVAAETITAPRLPEAETVVVLSRPDFEAAVREGLQNFTRLDILATNPLLRSRLVIAQTGAQASLEARLNALQTLAQNAAATLQRSPRDVKFYRALYHTYFQPAPTQEQAAELLDIPFSTFRRHLKTGLTRIADILWQQEISGVEK